MYSFVVIALAVVYILSAAIVGVWLHKSMKDHTNAMTSYDWYMCVVYTLCPVINTLLVVCLTSDAFRQSLKEPS